MRSLNYFIIKGSTHKPALAVRRIRSMGRAFMIDGKIHSAASGPARAFMAAQIRLARRMLRREGYRVYEPEVPGGSCVTYEVRMAVEGCGPIDGPAVWTPAAPGSVGIEPPATPRAPDEPPQQDGRS